eukprot:gene4852-6048_t
MSSSTSSDWAEAVTQDGKKFYYHKITRVSVWEKPDELKNAEESSNTASPPINIGPWKEYKAPSGKKYYHNSVTNETRWDFPQEYAGSSASNSNSSPSSSTTTNGSTNTTKNTSSTNNPLPSSSSTPVKQAQQNNPTTTATIAATTTNGNNTPQQQNNTLSKEDAVQQFKDLLAENEISSLCTFEKALRSISNDERYQSLKTMSERKQVFTDYQSERKKFELEERRKKEKKAKDDFISLLTDTKEISHLMSWRHAALLIENDPRWDSVESEREKEDIFRDYINELERLEKEELLSVKKENMKLLRLKLESDPSINVNSQWRKVKDQYENDPLYQSLDKFDFISVYESYIRDLEKKSEDSKRLEKEKLKREARRDRDAFRELLNDKFNKGELHALTRWKVFKTSIENEPSFQNLASRTIGSTPLELFSDYKEELEIKYEKDYRRLKEIVKSVGFNYIPNQTTFESFQEAISKHEKTQTISPTNFLPFLEHLKYKEESKERNEAKKKKKKISHYKQMLVDSKQITKSSNWIEIRPTIMNQKEFEDLDDEHEREKIFNSYVEYLGKIDEEESDEEGEISPTTGQTKDITNKDTQKKRKAFEIHSDDENGDRKDRSRDRNRDSRGRDRDRSRDRSRDRDRDRNRDSRERDRDRDNSPDRRSYKKEKRR